MTYLLDVNALVALGLAHHEFHDRVAAWVRTAPRPTLVTCAITELRLRACARASARLRIDGRTGPRIVVSDEKS